MKISEVEARSGVPASTLRYYESLGLLAPRRSDNGYRAFTESDIQRLDLIGSAKQLGLELPEILDLLVLADAGTCTGVKASLQPVLTGRLEEVDRQIAALSRLRDHLVSARDHVVSCPDSDEPCRSECAFKVLARTQTVHQG